MGRAMAQLVGDKSRKVAGLIPDEVTSIFQLLNQPPTEMFTRNIFWKVNAAGA
jgi:hypothetical protein